METGAKEILTVQVEDIGIPHLINVYVQLEHFGMDFSAWLSQIVAAEKHGTQRNLLANVFLAFTGMNTTVFCA